MNNPPLPQERPAQPTSKDTPTQPRGYRLIHCPKCGVPYRINESHQCARVVNQVRALDWSI
jgi:hypothetical protein